MHTESPVKAEDISPKVAPEPSPEGLPLVAYEQYQQARAHVFPSVDSLRWFERQQKAELLAAGAICMPAGRKLIIPALFDGVVIEVGLKLAATRGGRG